MDGQPTGMSALFNQYSFVLICLGILVGLFLLLRFVRATARVTTMVLGAVALLLFASWLVLRPGLSDVSSVEAAEAAINSGKPTLVEFFSNYCAGCIAARAAVDRLVVEMDEEFGDAFNVLRVDIHTGFGRALRERYGFSYTPEFVLFSAAGEEIWRAHVPPTFADLQTVAAGGIPATR